MSTTLLEEKELQSMEDAIALADEIERMEAVVSTMKNKIKAFVELNGPVKTQDKTWDFRESTSWKFAPDGLKELAIDLATEGKDPWVYLSISSSDLDKLGLPEEMLELYAKKTTRKSFRSVKND